MLHNFNNRLLNYPPPPQKKSIFVDVPNFDDVAAVAFVVVASAIISFCSRHVLLPFLVAAGSPRFTVAATYIFSLKVLHVLILLFIKSEKPTLKIKSFCSIMKKCLRQKKLFLSQLKVAT